MKRTIISILFLAANCTALAQKDDSTIDIIKKNLAASKEKVKHYEWVETTTVFLDGSQKSLKQNRCYYDATGKLMKVATGDTQTGKKPGGIRGKIAENKKEDIQAYIEKSIAKIQSYLPPDPGKIQQIHASGKTVVHVLEPNKKFKIDFPDYLQKGDQLSIEIDKEKKLLIGVTVDTYIDKPDDKVNFDVKYDLLPDGTQYIGETILDAHAKKVKIVIQNSGYKKTAE